MRSPRSLLSFITIPISLCVLVAACVTTPDSLVDLPESEQWLAAEAAQQAGDLERAQQMYEVIFARQRVPAAAWRSAELVVRLRERQPDFTFEPSDDSFRLVARVLALAIEGDVDTARGGIELLRGRIEDDLGERGLATLLLGDLDMRAGDHAAAAEKYWSVAAELLMDDYRDRGRQPGEVVAWAALRGMECAVLLDDWLVARRRLGLFESFSLAPAARPFANPELAQRVRDEFPRWLERVTDPNETRAGVRRQLATRPFTDGVVEQVGNVLVEFQSSAKLREFQLLLTDGDVMSATVPEGTTLDPASYVGHGRIDRADGGIAWGIIDHGRLREGIALAAIGTFDVVDDFEVQNTVVMRGEKLRAGGSVQRHTLRVFRTIYDDDHVAVDYFDRATGRHMQLQWNDLSMLSVTNAPMKVLSDADRAEELASEERYRRYGSVESDEDRDLREWRERTGSRPFQFNVDPENHVCIKCRGVGSLWRGGYAQQNVWVWQEGLNPSDRRLENVTLYRSGDMETCNWCGGTGLR